MAEHRSWAPTHYGKARKSRRGADDGPKFGDPRVPVLVGPSDGLKIVLGCDNGDNSRSADIQIERRPHGWAIFLQSVGGGCDSSGIVFFLDTGQSFVMPESGLGPTPSIERIRWENLIRELDDRATFVTTSAPTNVVGFRPDTGTAGDIMAEEGKYWAPTYLTTGNRTRKSPEDERPEFREPFVPVLVTPAAGLCVVLGSHDKNSRDAADILIERRPHGWAIFLQPVATGDSGGAVFFLDDGRSFVMAELDTGMPVPIEWIDSEDSIPELDNQ